MDGMMSAGKRKYTFALGNRDPRFTTVEKQSINPFTREPMTIKSNRRRGWNAKRRDALHDRLDECGAQTADDGYYLIRPAGGEEIVIFFGPDGDGGEGSEVSITCERVSDETAALLIDLIRTADMVMIPENGEQVPVAVLDRPIEPAGQKKWPDTIVVRSPGDLIDWLERVGHHEPD